MSGCSPSGAALGKEWQKLVDPCGRKRDGGKNDRADDHLECEWRDAHQVQPVLGNGHHQHPENASDDRPLAAAEPRAAENRCGKDVEFTTVKRVRNDLLGVVGLHQPSDTGHQS